MRIDLTNYKNLYYGLKNIIEIRGKNDILNIISDYAIGSGCPIIVICYFAIKLVGNTPELKTKINSLKDFYKYSEIKGLDELEKWD